MSSHPPPRSADDAHGELWVVRHGETEWSRDHRHTSTTDLPLTEKGLEQARTLQPRLREEHFDLVLTSPRRRAQRTAEEAGCGDAVVDDDLVEWDYGAYEGLSTEQIRESVPDWTVWTHPCPGGESAEQVARRLDWVVDRVHRTGRVLVFSHGHAARALAARWLGRPVSTGGSFVLDTATVSVLGSEHGSPAVVRWNC